MPIYEKPARLLFVDMIEELQLRKGITLHKTDILNWFRQNYPRLRENTVRAHLTKMTTNDPSRRWHNVDPRGQHDVFYRIKPGVYRLYDASTDPSPIYLTTVDVQTAETEKSVTNKNNGKDNKIASKIERSLTDGDGF